MERERPRDRETERYGDRPVARRALAVRLEFFSVCGGGWTNFFIATRQTQRIDLFLFFYIYMFMIARC